MGYRGPDTSMLEALDLERQGQRGGARRWLWSRELVGDSGWLSGDTEVGEGDVGRRGRQKGIWLAELDTGGGWSMGAHQRWRVDGPCRRRSSPLDWKGNVEWRKEPESTRKNTRFHLIPIPIPTPKTFK